MSHDIQKVIKMDHRYKCKTIKLFGKTSVRKSLRCEARQRLRTDTPKAKTLKGKTDKLDFIKIKIFLLCDLVKRRK